MYFSGNRWFPVILDHSNNFVLYWNAPRVLLNIYRPPTYSENLLEDFTELFSSISTKQKAPLRKATSVTAQKRECRKVEHIWRKTKLHNHHIYKESLCAYNLDLKSGRKTFFSNIIKTNTNKCKNPICSCWQTDQTPNTNSTWSPFHPEMQWVCSFLFW